MCKRSLWKRASLSIGGPLGDWGGGLFIGDFKRQYKRPLEIECVSPPRNLCEGKLEGGLIYWGSCRICKERFWKQVSLSKGASLGEQGGDAALLGTLRGR